MAKEAKKFSFRTLLFWVLVILAVAVVVISILESLNVVQLGPKIKSCKSIQIPRGPMFAYGQYDIPYTKQCSGLSESACLALRTSRTGTRMCRWA